MADRNKNKEIRNKRREKQRLREKSSRIADDWEEYANKELLDIGEDYPFMDWEEDEIYPRDYT